MSINKKLLLIIFSLLIFSNLSILKANEEKINLDDEELPAIDPFQGNTVNMNQGQSVDQNNSNIGGGLLNGIDIHPIEDIVIDITIIYINDFI